MRKQSRGIVLAMAVAVAASACGDGGGDESPRVTPTSTTAPLPTTTPRAIATPTQTPPIPVEPCFEGPALSVTARALPGGFLELGWTGIWHDVAVTHENLVTANLDCPGDFCTIDGSDLVGRGFGAPLPLSAGGVSLCVSAAFREAVTGTYGCESGCYALSARLSVRVFPADDPTAPCPACVGDPTPNDGRKRGTCRGGATPGAACDVGGISDLVPDAAGVSKDCLPAGTTIGDVDVDIDPLTTATVAVEPNVDCALDTFAPGSCFCPGQVQPNACEPDGVCPPSGFCERGPIDSVCDGQPSRPCRSGTGTDDCETLSRGAGSCVDQPRQCFGSQIARTGICGTQWSELVSVFCIPATGAASIDTMVGLPGPATITLPVALVRTVRQ